MARLAEAFAEGLHWSEEAWLAGLLHDLGKYGDRFQARLRGQDSGLDHWSQGAWLALSEHRSVAAALAIQGHHVGLQRGDVHSLRQLAPQALTQHHPFRLELSDPDLPRLKRRAGADGLAWNTPASTALRVQAGFSEAVAAMLDVRMLFSCLVDADFLDTEAHFEGDGQGKRYRSEGPPLDANAALSALQDFLEQKVRLNSRADANVLGAREALWCAATDSATREPGLFTLTAPTGSGKTLAMLKFALEHATRYGLRRIVLAVPFLTIIEQTARIYRSVFSEFPEHFVLEHHSLAGLGREAACGDAEEDRGNSSERHRRMLSENWDAPVVLTTNVQLLESLFSNRPAACRKLHNLAGSVILFDEAQSLPQHLAVPTLAALSHLSAGYRATVVFATATQPAFDTLHDAVSTHATTGWRPREAVPHHASLFASLRRVAVRWPAPREKTAWAALADELRSAGQALVVVNLKRHARGLLEMLAGVEGVFHLSTNLCAEHRRAVLDEVRERLTQGKTCRLISTQCVEAGVDVDFPRVFRALAPLESVAQAAGRCNREGRLSGIGEVTVFEP
ncbi:MAG TPA: CRISPR-associated endonuclease Cas3'', partial [Burkholderiales bacterium]|nr:CRISPR-associated endonuclease Cas3'' [Burkholderiales bacterium]